MKNTFGNSITITLFGESHGPGVGAVIDGLAPGIEIDDEVICANLAKRRPSSSLDTPRREQDEYAIVSGAFEGKTTGTPLTILIPNEDTHSSDYTYGPARPSHADFTAFCKYHGFEDYRGGGHFSGRITAALVAAGGILLPALERLGILIGTRIYRCAGLSDRGLENIEEDIRVMQQKAFPVLDEEAERKMKGRILAASKKGDSVGGITETIAYGVPAGLGEPWFDSVESELSHILFSLGGLKGVEFGAGFGFAKMKGSKANDPIRYSEEGKIYTETNNNGGINGGITNGMPVVFRCAIKPTASIGIEQQTVDFLKKENIDHTIQGRHDPAIIRRVCPVIDSVTAIVIADLLAGRYGTDFIVKGAGKWNTD